MLVPNNILTVLQKINESEERWKALYMATWGHSYTIKSQFENTTAWEKPLKLGLPASKNGFQEYTPKKLYSILTTMDDEFTFGHLQSLFSLFEDLLNESSKILCSGEINTSKWPNMEKFFNEVKILSDSELKELKLAKETRNCYIHNGGKIDQRRVDAYKAAKGTPIANVNDNLQKGFPKLFHQIEDWHSLIAKTANKIKDRIESK
jgi:hypothetical protein